MDKERRPVYIGGIAAGLLLLLLVAIGSVIAWMVSQLFSPGLNEQHEQLPTPAPAHDMPMRQQAPTTTLRSVTRPTEPPPDYAVSAEEAGAIALDAASGARLLQPPELVNFEGTVAYEVLLNQGVVYVDAEDGTILYSNVNVYAETPTTQGRISREQAIAIAVEYAGGGSVAEASLEDEHGKLVYEIEFTNHGKVYVDATNGEVVWARLNAPNIPHHNDRIPPHPGLRGHPNFGFPDRISPYPDSDECPDLEQPYGDEDEDEDDEDEDEDKR